MQVDCAYYSDELQEANLDPGKELKQLLEARGLQGLESSCPECFQNQQKLVSGRHSCPSQPHCALSASRISRVLLEPAEAGECCVADLHKLTVLRQANTSPQRHLDCCPCPDALALLPLLCCPCPAALALMPLPCCTCLAALALMRLP